MAPALLALVLFTVAGCGDDGGGGGGIDGGNAADAAPPDGPAALCFEPGSITMETSFSAGGLFACLNHGSTPAACRRWLTTPGCEQNIGVSAVIGFGRETDASTYWAGAITARTLISTSHGMIDPSDEERVIGLPADAEITIEDDQRFITFTFTGDTVSIVSMSCKASDDDACRP